MQAERLSFLAVSSELEGLRWKSTIGIRIEDMAMKKIGVDVGGTFTDLVVIDDTTGLVCTRKYLNGIIIYSAGKLFYARYQVNDRHVTSAGFLSVNSAVDFAKTQMRV